MDDDDMPQLGPCCICRGERDVMTIVMLDVKNEVPGHGWGCVVCNLPMDGASAVICNSCFGRYQRGDLKLVDACRGYAATDGRVAIETLTVPHKHDLTVEH